METRKLILESAGHQVMLAISDSVVRETVQRYSFDVAVLGQNLDEDRKKSTFKFLRANCPKLKILELHGTYKDRVLDSADDWLVVPVDVPRELAERVSALATRP